eukprot:4319454-Amphidinium_carterae.1
MSLPLSIPWTPLISRCYLAQTPKRNPPSISKVAPSLGSANHGARDHRQNRGALSCDQEELGPTVRTLEKGSPSNLAPSTLYHACRTVLFFQLAFSMDIKYKIFSQLAWTCRRDDNVHCN